MPLTVRRSDRARRIILRLDSAGDGATVTVPPGVPFDEGLAMARRKAGWIVARLDALPPRVPFADGAVVPFLGEAHRVRHAPGGRRGVWREDGEIRVSGAAEHLARRLGDWMRREARCVISPRVMDLVARLGRHDVRISIRDPRTRWGSCSARGTLSFSWRLVMAPLPVLDYVVAHEVAHLAERGHGPRFWRTVAGLADDVDWARAWLNCHGAGLHRFG